MSQTTSPTRTDLGYGYFIVGENRLLYCELERAEFLGDRPFAVVAYAGGNPSDGVAGPSTSILFVL